jgi:hypothetical protein
MTAFVGLIERADPRSPSFDDRALSAAVSGARCALCSMPEARALARIASVARREAAGLDRPAFGSAFRPAFNICLDAFTLARDELDNLVHLACRAHDLDRTCLPSTGEMVDLLSAPGG